MEYTTEMKTELKRTDVINKFVISSNVVD